MNNLNINVDEQKKEKDAKNFIELIIEDDIRKNKNNGQVITRFPPEPNGYLHIGHAKAICLNFGIAEKYKGRCHLRFDDTNPTKENKEYTDSIIEDIKWLGFDWGEHLYWASDYFDRMYELAIKLIKKGLAYVDSLNSDEIREYRGTLKEPGRESPYRKRSIEKNIELFERMKNGEFEDGAMVLRAKIDMSHPNLNMRDPVMYRILHQEHHRTGRKWCIYPMYDWAHGLEDSFEGITHSLCTLEFENHRPLYDWFLEQLPNEHHPQQIEFARLNLTYTVMSKRKLLELVQKGIVDAWDDPRMPTISGLRRRGYTSTAIRNFAERIGIAKSNSIVDISLLEYYIREELNKTAERRMAVLDPLLVIIDNYPEDKEESFEALNNPEDEDAGKRLLPFSRKIYIERDDFMENPVKKFFRLSPGKEIRLKHAYYIKCVEVVKDINGNIKEIHCTYDPESRGGWTMDGRKVRGTSHWVSAKHGKRAEVRLYDRLFTIENPDEVSEGKTYMDYINPESKIVLKNAIIEPCLCSAKPNERFQFLRKGYFIVDKDTNPENPVFNRIISLKDTWAKIQNKSK